MENPIKMDDLGIPLVLETPISGFTVGLMGKLHSPSSIYKWVGYQLAINKYKVAHS